MMPQNYNVLVKLSRINRVTIGLHGVTMGLQVTDKCL